MEYKWLGALRNPVRSGVFKLLSQLLATDDGRRLLADSLKGSGHAVTIPRDLRGTDAIPYPELGGAIETDASATAPVFLTGRFRSGSTLLWNVFRNVPECTSFYEPLNERRWFDPRTRGERVDATHLGVEEYWREYQGLEHLGAWYRPEWIERNLYMSEQHWDPNLLAYVRGLINAAPHRAVLQFNRIDFRLPWLRRNFPDARLIHMYRHPRDQWCSSLVDVKSFPRDATVAEFAAHDHFYLLTWAKDLAYHFPFLDPRDADHPYDLFYLIWKLSFLFGQTYCDASFCFETFCSSVDRELPRLMSAARVTEFDLAALRRLVVPQKSKWQLFADQDWFAEREARCETILDRFLTDQPRDLSRN
jgi:hypothetical protein